MTSNTMGFHGVCKYSIMQNIQIADNNTLFITAVGYLGFSFYNAFVSLGSSTNLIFVRKLVDNNCNVHFSPDSCLM